MVFIISTYQGLICVFGVHAFLRSSGLIFQYATFQIKHHKKLLAPQKPTPRQKHPPFSQYEKYDRFLNIGVCKAILAIMTLEHQEPKNAETIRRQSYPSGTSLHTDGKSETDL
jgi:hypothetical protein